jgi:hypothetical protein
MYGTIAAMAAPIVPMEHEVMLFDDRDEVAKCAS